MFAFSRFSTLSGPSRLGAASLNPTYPCSSKSLASTSRLSPAVLLHTGLTRRTYHSATSKGKEREPDTSMIHPLPINATANLSRKTSRYLSRRYPQATPTHVQSGTLLRTAQCRNFHSTSPRSAIPLIPAGLVIFKVSISYLFLVYLRAETVGPLSERWKDGTDYSVYFYPSGSHHSLPYPHLLFPFGDNRSLAFCPGRSLAI